MILQPQEYWEMKHTPKKGRGLFAKKDIEAGVVLADYIGKLVPWADEEKYDKDGIYLMYYNTVVSLYPEVKKPGAHILNHSCEPNCWMYTYKGHTLFFTLRKIHKGEELTISYLISPEDKDCNPCTHLCYCGTKLCTGTMHMTQAAYDKWITFHDKVADKTKVRTRYPKGSTLPLLDSYPQEIKDHPIYTLFGSNTKKPLVVKSKKLPTIKELRKLIRESGRSLSFPKLGVGILGIKENLLISKPA